VLIAISVCCVSVNITFLFTIFKVGGGHGFLQLPDICYKNRFIACQNSVGKIGNIFRILSLRLC
jgi:hypothetical protein